MKKKTSPDDLPPKMRPGAPIQVKLSEVNLLNQVITWSLVTKTPNTVKKQPTSTKKTQNKKPRTRRKRNTE
nr:hypothetical protein [Chlamydia abortus]